MTVDTTRLEQLIETGSFQSRVDEYINRVFRGGDKDTFYARTLAANGRDAAELELAEWAKRRHAYAASIEPIARGILALAKVESESVIDIAGYTPRDYTSMDVRHKFIAFNKQAPGCGCMQPNGYYEWGPYGEFGLRAVILQTGYSYDGPACELSLVVSAWGTGRSAPKPGDFVVVSFDATGFSSGVRYSPYTFDNEASEHFNDVDTFLRYMLGMNDIDRLSAVQTRSGINQVIGFPGAESLLGVELPKLSDYLVALADKLSAPHKH